MDKKILVTNKSAKVLIQALKEVQLYDIDEGRIRDALILELQKEQ